MLSQLLLLLGLLLVRPAEAHALASTAPDYLDADRAAEHLRWARVAGAAHAIAPELLLAIAWHESRYTPGEATPETGRRVSCGVMTPVPHAAPCSDWELSVPGGYWEGARHLREWIRICRRAGARDAERCAILAYAGGGWLVQECVQDDRALDACDLPRAHAARARKIRDAIARAEARHTLKGSAATMPHITHSSDVSRLLNLAQRTAIFELTSSSRSGRINATPAALAELARVIKAAIRGQVELGLWRRYGVDDVAKLTGLGVTASLGNQLLGEPPVKIAYDFSRTSLPLLVVQSVKVEPAEGEAG